MPTRQLMISAREGMHARPVAELARLALAHPDPVTLTTAAGTTVDASSVLAVMDLTLVAGDTVHLETPASEAAESLLDAMTAILAPRA